MRARFRQLYGASPLHLLALLASLALAGAAIVRWFDSGSDTLNILIWFGGAILGHDLVLLPLYSLLDRIARRGRGAPPLGAAEHGPGWVYVRVPALLSGLLALVFFPAILKLGAGTYADASGLHRNGYLARWLVTCGALFALSGIAYAVRLARTQGAARTARANESAE
jgi:hypothetical protein